MGKLPQDHFDTAMSLIVARHPGLHPGSKDMVRIEWRTPGRFSTADAVRRLTASLITAALFSPSHVHDTSAERHSWNARAYPACVSQLAFFHSRLFPQAAGLDAVSNACAIHYHFSEHIINAICACLRQVVDMDRLDALTLRQLQSFVAATGITSESPTPDDDLLDGMASKLAYEASEDLIIRFRSMLSRCDGMWRRMRL